MLSRQMRKEQVSLWGAVRFELCRLGITPGLHVPYWRYVLQADKVKRQTLAGQTYHRDTATPKSGPIQNPKSQTQNRSALPLLVPFAAKEHAWRALVEKYVKDGLDRKVLLALLFNVLTVRLD